MKARATAVIAVTLMALGTTAGAAVAGPSDVPGPPTHEHTMVVPGTGGVVQVGPPACRVPQAERGARNFHLKVHSEMAGAAPTTRAGLDIGFALGFPGCPG